jgi:mannosyltransferase
MSIFKNLTNKLTLDRNLISLTLPCLVVILGTALRFYDLGAESFWFDEVYMVHVAQASLKSIIFQARSGFSPPVYYILAHFWMRALGTTETATRSLSALAGIASIAVLYAVGRELFGRKVGLLSALLMAVSEFQIHYSQEYRYYAVVLLMTLLSVFFCIRALKDGRRSYFALYVLASVLLFWTHTYGLFVLAAQNLYFLLRWKRCRKARVQWLVCQMLILLAVGSGLVVSVKPLEQTVAGERYWLPALTLRLPLRTLYWYVLPLRHERSWTTVVVNFAAGMAFFVIGILLFAIRRGKAQWLASVRGLFNDVQDLSSRADELLLVSCWLLCPIILPLVLSKLLGPMYAYSYTIGASPALYLLLALGMTAVREVVPELISLGTLAILIVPGLQNYYVTDVKEQWRAVAIYVEENAERDDVIVFAPDENGWQGRCFYWYYRGDLTGCGIAAQLTDDEAIAGAVARCTSGSERFWLIMRGHSEVVDRFADFFLNHDHEYMRLVREQQFMYISVYLFELTGQ